MNEHQRRWLHELRHGGHQQGREQLATYDPETGTWSFCCLGVAAHHVFGEPIPAVEDLAYEQPCYLFSLRPDHSAALGLTKDDEHDLGQLNDEGLTFEQVAVVLELAFDTGKDVRTAARALGHEVRDDAA